MKSLPVRLLTSALLIGLALLAIFVFPNWVFALVCCGFIFFGLYEFYTLLEQKKIPISKYYGVFVGLLIPLSTFFRFEPTKGWELAFIVAAILSLFLFQFTRRESSQAIVGVATTLFGIFYVSWFFSFLIKLKYVQNLGLPNGNLLVTYLLLVTKVGDAGAYFAGSAFGKHTLIPRISPKKSVEGSVGGFLASLGASIACKVFLPGISIGHLIALGLLLGAAAQIGDLSESLIKRDCKVKDSSPMLPGLGGVLDVIDSILFTAPIFYFYVMMLLE